MNNKRSSQELKEKYKQGVEITFDVSTNNRIPVEVKYNGVSSGWVNRNTMKAFKMWLLLNSDISFYN